MLVLLPLSLAAHKRKHTPDQWLWLLLAGASAYGCYLRWCWWRWCVSRLLRESRGMNARVWLAWVCTDDDGWWSRYDLGDDEDWTAYKKAEEAPKPEDPDEVIRAELLVRT